MQSNSAVKGLEIGHNVYLYKAIVLISDYIPSHGASLSLQDETSQGLGLFKQYNATNILDMGSNLFINMLTHHGDQRSMANTYATQMLRYKNQELGARCDKVFTVYQTIPKDQFLHPNSEDPTWSQLVNPASGFYTSNPLEPQTNDTNSIMCYIVSTTKSSGITLLNALPKSAVGRQSFVCFSEKDALTVATTIICDHMLGKYKSIELAQADQSTFDEMNKILSELYNQPGLKNTDPAIYDALETLNIHYHSKELRPFAERINRINEVLATLVHALNQYIHQHPHPSSCKNILHKLIELDMKAHPNKFSEYQKFHVSLLLLLSSLITETKRPELQHLLNTIDNLNRSTEIHDNDKLHAMKDAVVNSYLSIISSGGFAEPGILNSGSKLGNALKDFILMKQKIKSEDELNQSKENKGGLSL